MPRIYSFVLALLAALCLTAQHSLCSPDKAPDPQATRYKVQDLGILSGYDMAVATGINDKGEVVGVALKSGNFEQKGAFVWRKGKMMALAAPGCEASYASAINNRGDILGYGRLPGDKKHLLLWSAGKERTLTQIAETEEASCALNQKGLVVFRDAAGVHLWPSHTLLDIPPPNDKFVRLSALNDQGDLVGIFARYGGEFSFTIAEAPFLYRAGKVLPLGTLGGKRSVCNDINKTRQVVGWAEDAEGVRHGCLWKDGALEKLDVPDARSSEAAAINDAGVSVGHYSSQQVSMRACLWWKGEAVDLNARISPDSGWTLHYANGINRRGQIIGSGYYNGLQRAFLLTPTH